MLNKIYPYISQHFPFLKFSLFLFYYNFREFMFIECRIAIYLILKNKID